MINKEKNTDGFKIFTIILSGIFAGFTFGFIFNKSDKDYKTNIVETTRTTTGSEYTNYGNKYTNHISTKQKQSTGKTEILYGRENKEHKNKIKQPDKEYNMVKSVWGVKWYPSTFSLYNKLRKLGYNDYNAKLIITACKKYSFYPRGCIIALSSVGMAESSAFNRCYNNNCLGLYKGKSYKSVRDNVLDWIKKFNKYWYTFDRYPDPAHFFYSVNGVPSKSRYCTEESSSGFKKFDCINGYKHFRKVYLYLKK